MVGGAAIGATLAAPATTAGAVFTYGVVGLEGLRGLDVGVAGVRDLAAPETRHPTITNQLLGDRGEFALDMSLLVVNVGQGVYALVKTYKGAPVGVIAEGSLDEVSRVADDLVTSSGRYLDPRGVADFLG